MDIIENISLIVVKYVLTGVNMIIGHFGKFVDGGLFFQFWDSAVSIIWFIMLLWNNVFGLYQDCTVVVDALNLR